MSSRATISYYEGPFHLYEEVFTDDICFDMEGPETDRPKNEYYGDVTISFDALKRLHSDIGKYIEQRERRIVKKDLGEV